MTGETGARHRHDAFAKQVFEALLADQGQFESQMMVAADPQHADVYFSPSGPLRGLALGVVGRLVGRRCLVEIYRQTPGADDILDEQEKALTLSRALSQRGKKPERIPTWVISPGRPESALANLGFGPDTDIMARGFYQMAPGHRVGLVVVSELPENEETLSLRLFGRGAVQQRALDELFERRQQDERLGQLWALVRRWRIRMDNTQQDDWTEADREFFANIDEIVRREMEEQRKLDEAHRQLDEAHRRLTEEHQHLAEEHQHLAEEHQHLDEAHQNLNEAHQHLTEEQRLLQEKHSRLAEEKHRLADETRRLAGEANLLKEHLAQAQVEVERASHEVALARDEGLGLSLEIILQTRLQRPLSEADRTRLAQLHQEMGAKTLIERALKLDAAEIGVWLATTYSEDV